MIQVTFTSVSPYYEAERDNLKPNTIRKYEYNDLRFDKLRDWAKQDLTKLTCYIVIQHNRKDEKYFIRRIKHVIEWECFFIISWFEAKKNGKKIKKND